MAVVYAVQEPHWRDRATGNWVPKFDLSPCKEFGELRFLLPPHAGHEEAQAVMRTLYNALEGYTEDDYILLIGNPVLIALTAIAAADAADRVKYLQWSGRARCYVPIIVDL